MIDGWRGAMKGGVSKTDCQTILLSRAAVSVFWDTRGKEREWMQSKDTKSKKN